MDKLTFQKHRKILQNEMDDKFKIDTIRFTHNPQQLCYLAMHQDHSEKFVSEEIVQNNFYISETEAGKRIIRNALKFKHWGIIEHPQISFNIGYFPHSTMVQARTHRISYSFDVQSLRYTSKHIEKVINDEIDIENIFYFRPIGKYFDRNGNKYEYTENEREIDKKDCFENCIKYVKRLEKGYAPEHARDKLNLNNIRQHFFMSCNLLSLIHFINLRIQKNAQWEIQCMSELLLQQLENWCPEVADWYFSENKEYEKKKRIL